jgi:hypothetical protein
MKMKISEGTAPASSLRGLHDPCLGRQAYPLTWRAASKSFSSIILETMYQNSSFALVVSCGMKPVYDRSSLMQIPEWTLNFSACSLVAQVQAQAWGRSHSGPQRAQQP